MPATSTNSVHEAAGPKIEIARVALSGGQSLILDSDRHTLCLHPSSVRFDRVLGRRIEPFLTQAGFIGVVPAGTDCMVDIANSGADVIRVSIEARHLEDVAIDAGTSLAAVMTDRHGRDLMMLHLALAYLGEAERETADALSLEATANAMLTHLVRRYAERRRSDGATLSPRCLGLVDDYIGDHLSGNITLAKMAAVAGVSLFHFSRLFSATAGVTPHRYVMARRTAQAVLLLRTTRLGLAEIAEECGFSDQSHLTRWVKARQGVTPGRLRRHP